VYVAIKCEKDDDFSVCFEFTLFEPESLVIYSPKGGASHSEVSDLRAVGLRLGECVISHQGIYGDGVKKELSNYNVESSFNGGMAEHLFSAAIPKEKWDGKRAIKMCLQVGGVKFKEDPDPVFTLGKSDLSPDEFVFLLPTKR
jgi:hypothetical protein